MIQIGPRRRNCQQVSGVPADFEVLYAVVSDLEMAALLAIRNVRFRLLTVVRNTVDAYHTRAKVRHGKPRPSNTFPAKYEIRQPHKGRQ
jgi:hypothetical protein